MVEDVLSETESGMTKAIEAFQHELAKVRTGRANLALLDGIKIDYYGTMTPLNQVASLNVVDARLITVKPWEKNMIQVIEKAIRANWTDLQELERKIFRHLSWSPEDLK